MMLRLELVGGVLQIVNGRNKKKKERRSQVKEARGEREITEGLGKVAAAEGIPKPNDSPRDFATNCPG
jgi:hypothetical protein